MTLFYSEKKSNNLKDNPLMLDRNNHIWLYHLSWVKWRQRNRCCCCAPSREREPTLAAGSSTIPSLYIYPNSIESTRKDFKIISLCSSFLKWSTPQQLVSAVKTKLNMNHMNRFDSIWIKLKWVLLLRTFSRSIGCHLPPLPKAEPLNSDAGGVTLVKELWCANAGVVSHVINVNYLKQPKEQEASILHFSFCNIVSLMNCEICLYVRSSFYIGLTHLYDFAGKS